MNGINHEWAHWCNQSAQRNENFVQGVLTSEFVSRFSFIPQSSATSANVPIRQIVDDEIFKLSAGLVEVPVCESIMVCLRRTVKLGQNPAIES